MNGSPRGKSLRKKKRKSGTGKRKKKSRKRKKKIWTGRKKRTRRDSLLEENPQGDKTDGKGQEERQRKG